MDTDLPYAEVTTPEYKQVELTPEEADLYGTALMNLIHAGLAFHEDTTDEKTKMVYHWAVQMQHLVDIQAAKAGMTGIPV